MSICPHFHPFRFVSFVSLLLCFFISSSFFPSLSPPSLFPNFLSFCLSSSPLPSFLLPLSLLLPFFNRSSFSLFFLLSFLLSLPFSFPPSFVPFPPSFLSFQVLFLCGFRSDHHDVITPLCLPGGVSCARLSNLIYAYT